ncbi:major intrinsically disordered NOTCH2-binding receptor 1-like [Spea bombifrons]|uniref:major intrinsically disordered NOTCH2-binding receptor 1-like n=1 Tax=Spea bombifrons TaxID=233779 RepID=UPI00234B4381|nr:major intrinsically disordered NOTCH2-binding receptor 1-like [Spea bombifrons]
MDLSVLPNNNHPDKFLRLDVRSLVANSGLLHGRQWHNKIYFQNGQNSAEPIQPMPKADSPVLVDKELRGHITPEILRSTIKSNPLFQDTGWEVKPETRKKGPAWTIKDYDNQSPTLKLSMYLKENPNDLKYWLEDIYTPGYDSLLRKNEKKRKNSKYCKIFMYVALAVCILVAIVTVTVLFT